MTPQALVELLSKGTNLLLALSPKKQTLINSLASEFSLILPLIEDLRDCVQVDV